jgi:hypothetical protein
LLNVSAPTSIVAGRFVAIQRISKSGDFGEVQMVS